MPLAGARGAAGAGCTGGATSAGGATYYWLTFSSKRGGGVPQLYVSPVVVSGTNVTTYPALYLWNQPAAESNHTPAWDKFDIIGFQPR